MSGVPQISLLPDGKRLHLNHGPIDLIIGVNSSARDAAFSNATTRFASVLDELVTELKMLRMARSTKPPAGKIAISMWHATLPFADLFITPMAAVAGAVADEILKSISTAPGLKKAYVNNGGDIAFFLSKGESVTAAMGTGTITINAKDPYRGIATSGWQGRSHSFGIADAVSVVAKNAALADAAATMIANAVDLPGHPAIQRIPATDLSPDSDLGNRPVTTAVSRLITEEINSALANGVEYAEELINNDVIAGASIRLKDNTCIVGAELKNAIQLTEQQYA